MASRTRRSAVPPARYDLLAVVLVLLLVDTIGTLYLAYVYLPARRREALERVPSQLSLLARDRQNALSGWVFERLSDVEFTASLLEKEHASPRAAADLLDRFIGVYHYESALIADDAGSVLVRRGSGETDDASIVGFALQAAKERAAIIDFRRASNRKPKVLAAQKFSGGTVVFVSDPYAYIYPLFSTTNVASKTEETNLIGLYGDTGVALTPYAGNAPPPMTVRKSIPHSYVVQALAGGERGIQQIDRYGHRTIGVVKAIARTPWVVIAKIDEDEVLAAATDETIRLGQLFGFVSLMLAMTAFAILRSRRVYKLRVAEGQLARLYENTTTGIVVLRVLFDGGAPIDHQLIDMNPAAERFLGSAEAADLRWPPEIRERNYSVVLTGRSIEYEHFDPAAGRWYDVRSFTMGGDELVQLLTDITERKKSEQTLRNISARLLRVQDDANRRIARQLHETIAQSLVGIRMNLGAIKRFITGNGRFAEALDESVTIADEALSDIRTLSYLLHPPMIDQAGLVTTLRWFVEGFQQRSGIVTALDVPDDLGRLSRDIETCVFRIVQESLTNVQRHAGSATATVSIQRRDEQLRIEVADQGRGLPAGLRDDRDALLASGVGVAGISERVHEFHGELTIRSSERGTALHVTLPV